MNESCVSHFMALADATVVSLQQSNTNASCHVSCHTSERVTSHTSESVVLLTLSLWQTQQLILCNSRTRMRHATHHVTHLNESRHTHLNQSCRSHYRCARRNSFFSATVAYEWVMSHIMSHIWMSHVTHIWISRVTHIIAVADATVVSLQQSSKVGGIRCDNLFAWNSIMLRLSGRFEGFFFLGVPPPLWSKVRDIRCRQFVYVEQDCVATVWDIWSCAFTLCCSVS